MKPQQGERLFFALKDEQIASGEEMAAFCLQLCRKPELKGQEQSKPHLLKSTTLLKNIRIILQKFVWKLAH